MFLPKNRTKGGTLELLPFLKWPGGKRWLVCNYPELLPDSFGMYIEPFVGAGAVYFHLRPARALLGDINTDLIDTYRALQFDWLGVRNSLRYRRRRHLEDPDTYYYWLREQSPADLVQRASRFIYLNRTCFNGIHRVNRHGKFNVPRGTKNTVVLDTDDFEQTSRALTGAHLESGDFEKLVQRATADDFLFCDPPYTVRHNDNGFRKYNEVLFSWTDQMRLARALKRAAAIGVKIMCTNANHRSVRELYQGSAFKLQVISRYSSLSATSNSRRVFEELIVRANY